MQSLYRNIKLFQQVEKVVEIRAALTGPENRISEHALAHRTQMPVIIRRNGSPFAQKVEPFKFLGEKSQITHLPGLPDHPLQNTPGTRRILKTRQEKRQVILPGHPAKSPDIDHGNGVRIPRMPARILSIVVSLVTRIPPEHHITKTKARFNHRPELVQADQLSPQHSINIRNSQLDLGGAFLCKLLQ